MWGADQQRSQMFSYLSPETRVRKDHALRAARRMVDEVLGTLSPQFDRMYAREGQPSAGEAAAGAIVADVCFGLLKTIARLA